MQTPDIPGPIAAVRRPLVRFPALATDCHAHVFGPLERRPVVPGSHYVPPDSLIGDYRAMLAAIGCGRGVLVQPSVYGTDNSAIEEALRAHPESLRGVAVVAPDVADRELERLHTLGFRGLRINVVSAAAGLRLEHAAPLAARLAPLGWHLQFYADLAADPAIAETLARLPIRIVIDHFGRVPARGGVDSRGFRALAGLLRHEHCWAKLMGPYFISEAADFADTIPLARALVAIAPDRLVWGTDWPHPGARAKMPNDGDLADLVGQWVPDAGVRERILVANPARLYGF